MFYVDDSVGVLSFDMKVADAQDRRDEHITRRAGSSRKASAVYDREACRMA